ncbi:hypothetical protein LG272_01395 [Pseudidiomarina marina]|uniref:RHS repeat domain-containing protein n=1 Tax=Pseudidiomarina marina TaxID=502366 RepID=UPI00384CBB48
MSIIYCFIDTTHFETVTGQLLEFEYGNGLLFNQSLDAKFRPDMRSISNSTALFEHTYHYDLNSNLLAVTDILMPVNTLTLGYDRLDRLTSADGAWGSGYFSYDALGNIISKTVGNENINYHYNSSNRLASVSGAVSRTFSYDSRGSVTSNGTRSFNYNRANRLISSDGITYQYDGHGRRVSKTEGGIKTYSLYNQQGTLLATYRNGNYIEYYHLGSQLVARHNDAPQQADGLGYTGHLEDDDLALTYMQARYYDPVIGRFYSNDPVDALGHIQRGNSIAHGFNRYAYANNNPYKYTDPDGEFVFLAIAAVGAAITAYDTYQTYQNEGAGAAAKSLAVGGLITAATGGVGKLAHSAYKAYKGAKVASGAESAVQGVKLEKQLASESQLTELAEGGGTVISQPAKQANRIAEQHGVDAVNVQKVSSSAHTAKDGSQVQTHAFRDASSNKVIEPKSIIDENN